MNRLNDTPDFKKMAQQLKKDAVRYAEVTGVRFFKESFQNQGFTNQSFEPWEKRKDDPDPLRKVLVKSSYLMESIQIFDSNEKKIVFGSDAEYGSIHNEGGSVRIPITQKSRNYFWYMFKLTNNSKWKGLALTKKTAITINIPKRQFMGESITLMNDLDDWLKNRINVIFKQL